MNRYQFKIFKLFANRILILLLAVTLFSCDIKKIDTAKKESIIKEKAETENEYLIVTRVIDGDTFKMSNGEKVRLLGIDTPEKYDSDKLERESDRTGRDKETIKKLGDAASDYVRNLAEGKKVTLVKESNYEDRDKYGRLLRYVYMEDGTFLNAKIIEDGYANVYNSANISKTDEFRKLEKDARQNKRGLWGEVKGLK